MENKECRKCLQDLPVSSFHKRGAGHQSYCKDCSNGYNTRRYQELPREKRRAAVRKQRYRLSPEDYQALLDKQEQVCAICSADSRSLVVDHDHDTNRVRGLLCSQCNTGIGLLGDGRNLEIFALARAYLEQKD